MIGCRIPCDSPQGGIIVIRVINNHISQKSVCKLVQTNGYIIFFGIKYMVKITCSKYGFDCDFEVAGNNSTVIEKYQMHSTNEHGIEQSEEALEHLVLRMN